MTSNTSRDPEDSPPSPSPPLTWEVGPVSRIILDRPHRQNALTVEMGTLMREAVSAINAASAPRVVLLEGRGRAFCAGGDFELIRKNAESRPAENVRQMVDFYSSFLSLLELRMPAVALIQGAAVGAGLCLALACDIRLAAHEAKLGANFVHVGLHPGMGASLLLPRLIGHARASELILTGRLVTGREAEGLGLVSRSAPRDELPALVDETLNKLTRAAPLALAQSKQTLLGSLKAELGPTLAREAEAQAVGFATHDLREAIRAFRAGEKPSFVGR